MPPAGQSPQNTPAAQNIIPRGRFPIESALRAKLAGLEVRPGDLSSRFLSQDNLIAMQAAVPRGKPLEWIVWQVSTATEGTAYHESDCTADQNKSSCTLTFISSSKRDPRVTLAIVPSDRFFSSTARMAIVVENLEDTVYQIAVDILSLPEPITISLSPAGKKAILIGQLAAQSKKETIIRLPLEPAGRVPKEFDQTTIMVHYPKQTIRRMIADDVRRFPDAKGFSNLWGSRALEDPRVMTEVLQDIKRLHGYFIESRAAKNSVAGAIAQTVGLPYAEFTARLDNAPGVDALSEIKRCAAAAQSKGSLLVRCTGTKRTGDALRAALPFLKQNGIQLVFVSDLLK